MAVSAYTDAQLNNNISRNVKQYSDLDLFFSKKIVDKDVNKVTDIQAVKRSIRNLVLLNTYEKPFHPEIGSGVRDMLFENMTPLTGTDIAETIFWAINRPTHVNINRIELMPLQQGFNFFAVSRTGKIKK